MDIAVKRDLERDVDATILLKALKVHNPLTRWLNFDGKGVHSHYNIKRVVHNMVVGESWIIFPYCCGGLDCGYASDNTHHIYYHKVEDMG